jgi:large subunit ribosomal protein L24
MAAKIKKGDNVFILSGKDKGKTGKVLKILKVKQTQTAQKAIVEGVNIAKKHTKQSATKKGGIESIEMPIYTCKLSLIDPKTSKPSRIGFKFLKDGKKVRFAKKSGETLT